MSETIRRLLKLQEGEGPRVFQFCLLSGLLQAGLAIGMSAADALFLTRVGADRLPVIFLLTPAVMLVYIPVYAYLVSRWGVDRVLDLTLAALVVGGVSLGFLLDKGRPLFFYGAKLYAGLWYIALYTLFWNFTDRFYDIQDAKRLFPIFSGGASTGAMLGGSLVGIASRHLPVERLFFVWAFLALVTLPLGIRLRSRWKRIEADAGDEKRSFLQEIQETRGFMRQSPFVRVFLAVLFTVLVLTAALEFQYSTVFSQGRSEVELASLLGTLFAVVSGFNLLLNFCLFNRMVLTLGVGNVVLITPVVYLAAFLGLLIHGGFGAAMFGFFAYQGILASIDWNNVNFLFNAVPAAARRQVRTVIEGLWEPIATAAAGGFLLLFATTRGYALITHRPVRDGVAFLAPDSITALGLAGCVVYLVLAAFLRASYLKSMVGNMKREWLDFSRPDAAVLSGLDRDEITALAERARGDGESARTALRILWLNDRRQGLDRLLEYLARAGEAEREAAAPLLEMMLADKDHETLRVSLDWLNAHGGMLGPALLQVLAYHGLVLPRDAAQGRLSPDPQERAAAVVACWNAWQLPERLAAMETAHALLDGDPEERSSAVRALGWTREERNAHTAGACLQDPDPAVRREALGTVRRLATPDSSRLAASLLRAIAAGDGEERLLAMEALRKITDPGSLTPLLALSDQFTPAERRRAEALLCDMGLRGVPAAVAVLRDPRASYPARSIAARALARIAFPQLESLAPSLIHAELRRAYECLHFHHALEVAEQERENAKSGRNSPQRHRDTEKVGTELGRETEFPLPASSSIHLNSDSVSPCLRGEFRAGLSVLSRYYRTQPGVIVDFVLELLTLGGRLPHFEQISAALRFGSRKERADALETVEQGASREIFRLLLPLVDGRSSEEQLRFYQSRFKPEPIEARDVLRAALASAAAVESAAAAQALHEMDDPEAVSLLRARLRQTVTDFGLPTARDTILSLLVARREDPTPWPPPLTAGEGEQVRLPGLFPLSLSLGERARGWGPAMPVNPIERLAVLARAPFFESCAMAELEALADAARPVRFEVGEWIYQPGERAEAFFVLASGVAMLERPVGEEPRQAGDVLGEELLFGEAVRQRAARSEGLHALQISAAAMSRVAHTYPRLGIGLLAEKLKASHAT